MQLYLQWLTLFQRLCLMLPRQQVQESLVQDVLIPAVPATCTSAGNIEYFECTVCGDIFRDRALTQSATLEEVTLAKLDHNYTADWISDENGHWHKCANCTAVPAAEAHEFVEMSDAQNHWKECSVCGYKKDIAANEFNIRFENYDGTLLQTKTVKYGVEPAYTECR